VRVRLIRPAYWTDTDLHTRLTADQREFYVGLWMLADDDGYVSWDVDRVGAELYPYRPLRWRRKNVPAWLEVIGPAHARLLECGRHVLVPNLPKYQSPPRPSSQVKREHMAACGATLRQVVPAREGKGKEGNGLDVGAPAGAGLKARLGELEDVLAAGRRHDA
jgi:hypothetical protein